VQKKQRYKCRITYTVKVLLLRTTTWPEICFSHIILISLRSRSNYNPQFKRGGCTCLWGRPFQVYTPSIITGFNTLLTSNKKFLVSTLFYLFDKLEEGYFHLQGIKSYRRPNLLTQSREGYYRNVEQLLKYTGVGVYSIGYQVHFIICRLGCLTERAGTTNSFFFHFVNIFFYRIPYFILQKMGNTWPFNLIKWVL
jgi:hypothetical protein